jgi:hypothetical protein
VIDVLEHAEAGALEEQKVIDAVQAGRDYFQAKKEFRSGK